MCWSAIVLAEPTDTFVPSVAGRSVSRDTWIWSLADMWPMNVASATMWHLVAIIIHRENFSMTILG